MAARTSASAMALKEAITGLEGAHAQGMIQLAGSPNGTAPIGEQNGQDEGRISTGTTWFDEITGGGLRRGQEVVIQGPPDTGKTTAALEACVEVTRRGKIAVFLDAEGKLSDDYIQALGVDVGLFAIVTLKAKDPFEAIRALADELEAKDASIDLIVIDTISVFNAKAAAQGLAKLQYVRTRHGAALLVLSQERFIPQTGKIVSVGGSKPEYDAVTIIQFTVQQEYFLEGGRPARDVMARVRKMHGHTGSFTATFKVPDPVLLAQVLSWIAKHGVNGQAGGNGHAGGNGQAAGARRARKSSAPARPAK